MESAAAEEGENKLTAGEERNAISVTTGSGPSGQKLPLLTSTASSSTASSSESPTTSISTSSVKVTSSPSRSVIVASSHPNATIVTSCLSNSVMVTSSSTRSVIVTSSLSNTVVVIPSSSDSVMVPSRPSNSPMDTSSPVEGRNPISSVPLKTLPKPPPLINTSSISTSETLKVHSVSEATSCSILKDGVEPTLTQRVSGNGSIKQSTPAPKLVPDVDSNQKIPPPPGGGGSPNVGLGAGKLKAFISILGNAATPKKQSTKKAGGTGGSGSKGQGVRSKPPPLSSSVPSKKAGGDQAPSRSSNRNIKRPRTYDEEMDELKSTKASFTKKGKTSSKVCGVFELVCLVDLGKVWSTIVYECETFFCTC